MGSDSKRRVVVWGTGNVGRPAIRAVASHSELELAGVIVANPDKVGTDAGTLGLTEKLDVPATDDISLAMADDIDAVVYTVNADFRPEESLEEITRTLAAGTDVVTPAFYPLYHPPSMPTEMSEPVEQACAEGSSSVHATGIDPGWSMDLLPLIATSVGAGITQIRSREIFNYALYDQPDSVRELIGFGQPLGAEPPMLLDFSLDMVWGPMVRVLADGLGLELDRIETSVEKRPLERTVTVEGMGDFESGTMGAFWFQVTGVVGGEPLIVLEHITRIDDDCAPDWPQPTNPGGLHQVELIGHPNLVLSVHGDEPGEPGAAGGGNALAANRLVNSIPDVCDAAPGIIHPLDLPIRWGKAQVVVPR